MSNIPSIIYPSLTPSTITVHHTPSSIFSVYLHGDGVFNQHGSQLPVHLKKDFSLAGLVQVPQCQGLNVEGLPSLQLHLM